MQQRTPEAPPRRIPMGNHEADTVVWASETRLRVVTSQMPAVLWTTDADLVITSGTGAGQKALGVSPDHFTGTSLFDGRNLVDHDSTIADNSPPSLLGQFR